MTAQLLHLQGKYTAPPPRALCVRQGRTSRSSAGADPDSSAVHAAGPRGRFLLERMLAHVCIRMAGPSSLSRGRLGLLTQSIVMAVALVALVSAAGALSQGTPAPVPPPATPTLRAFADEPALRAAAADYTRNVTATELVFGPIGTWRLPTGLPSPPTVTRITKLLAWRRKRPRKPPTPTLPRKRHKRERQRSHVFV